MSLTFSICLYHAIRREPSCLNWFHTHTLAHAHTHSHLLAAALIYRLFAALFDDFPLAICSISKEKSFKIIYRESREKFLIRSSLSIYRSLLLFLLLLHQTYFRWSVKRKMSEYFTKHSMCAHAEIHCDFPMHAHIDVTVFCLRWVWLCENSG